MTLIERLTKLHRIIVAERITIKLQRELDRYLRNEKIIDDLKRLSGASE